MRWNVHIYGPNSEVLGMCASESLDVGFQTVLKKDFLFGWPHVLSLFLRCQRQGPSYKTDVFFIFLLLFVSSLFRPISDFIASRGIEAGLVSLSSPTFDWHVIKRSQKGANMSLWCPTNETRFCPCVFNIRMFKNVFKFLLGREKKETETINSVKQVIFFKNIIFFLKEEINENVLIWTSHLLKT